MPVTKQAIKKVRQDKRKTDINMRRKKAYKKAVHDARSKKMPADLARAFKALDLAAKTNVIHKNKAARLKSRLSKLIGSSAPKATAKASVKKVVSKKASKSK